MAEEQDGETLVLRVAIQGGGCSGFQYGLGFEPGPPRATSSSIEGIPVVVDPYSAPYLRGTTIDFLNTIEEAGFKIDNPNAAASCGCGHSFQVEEGRRAARGHSRSAAAATVVRTDAASVISGCLADQPTMTLRGLSSS